MPAGSAAALICDTGALIDYLVESAPDHRLFRNALDQARTRYVPGLVLAEVDYFLRDERQAMHAFMQDLARGAFTYAPPTMGQLSRAMDVDRRFADLDLGLVDSSVVALAESLGIRRRRPTTMPEGVSTGEPLPDDVSALLRAWIDGDQRAFARLTPIVYDELHRVAHYYLKRERSGHSQQTTALVNGARMRLVDCERMQWQDRAQLLAVSAQAMRRLAGPTANGH